MLVRPFLVAAWWFATACSIVPASSPFTVVVYNVENLHDADGVAVYDDYQAAIYRPAHVATKVNNVTRVLRQFRDGAGPDIVLLQEIEIDQTPRSGVSNFDRFLKRWRGLTVEQMLGKNPLPVELAGVPAEGWLLKALADAGLTGYTMAVGADSPSPPTAESRRAIKCVTLSKFPITAVRHHPVESARMILETEIEVGGRPLHVFNNHWKSGAGDPQMELIRVQNATVLRQRLDQIWAEDPWADVIIGGDLNAHYNQKLRYPDMPRTGINDVLEVGYSERQLVAGGQQLYNLWFELEPARRGSDVYRGEWGTLMHLIVSRGLYDHAGIQYQDNSFNVFRLPGQNSDLADAPVRWSSGGPGGSGFSDHLPIYAHFRAFPVAAEPLAGKPVTMTLDRPADDPPSDKVWLVDYGQVDLNQAIRLDDLPPRPDLRDGTWTGKLFKVVGPAVRTRRPQVRFNGAVYDIYAPQSAIRDQLEAQAIRNHTLNFYGVLGTYQGNWQFVVHDLSWVP